MECKLKARQIKSKLNNFANGNEPLELRFTRETNLRIVLDDLEHAINIGIGCVHFATADGLCCRQAVRVPAEVLILACAHQMVFTVFRGDLDTERFNRRRF